MPERLTVDFGAWVRRQMDRGGIKTQALSAETGLLYAYLSRLINSGAKGKPILPEAETCEQIGRALQRLGIIEDYREAVLAAGYIPQGYVVIPEGDAGEMQRIPEAAQEIVDDMGVAQATGRLTPEKLARIKRYVRFELTEDDLGPPKPGEARDDYE